MSGGRTIKLKPEGAEAFSEINVRSTAENHYEIQVDGKTYVVSKHENYFILDNRIVPYATYRKGNSLQAWVSGNIATFELEDTNASRHGAGNHAGHHSGEITAPMPGTVLHIKVSPGDVVQAHQPLVIMESMKMEMTLSAPFDGIVDSVDGKEGTLVSAGTCLVVIQKQE